MQTNVRISMLYIKINFLLLCSFFSIAAIGLPLDDAKQERIEYVTIAILAKDKAHTLPLYLSCIEKQTWPANKTYIYIRTNNNNDDTANILLQWVEKNRAHYADIYFDSSDVPEQVQKYGQHEWNGERFKVLGKIRQDSVTWAKAHASHYFVVDCDNFIAPHTLGALLNVNLPVVAPLLRTGTDSGKGYSNTYSNYHAAIDTYGYMADSPLYYPLLEQQIKGLVQVPVVHCTYLVRHDVLDKISYDDESWRHEYVIFSDSARKQGVAQYLDTRDIYGRVSFAENIEELHKESWSVEFPSLHIQKVFTNIYKNNAWGDPETRSGSGSSLQQTKVVRAALPLLLQELTIKTLLDAACGDCNWVSQTDLSHLESYTGIDIVEDNIRNNRDRTFCPSTTFMMKNITEDPIDRVDLILCRDWLTHLAHQQVKQAVKNFKKSGSKYLLTTTYEKNDKNDDITTGYWAPLNLEKAPFNFPKPLLVIDEKATDWCNEKYGKTLALWLLEDINVED